MNSKKLKYIKPPLLKQLKVILLLLLITSCNGLLLSQTLNISKNVSTSTPNDGDPFSYIINASCNSSTNDCESVVFTDNLPVELEFLNFSTPLPDAINSATYDPVNHSILVTFDATGCATCTPDGINTDNDDFAQGSTIQFEIQVRFPYGTFNGTTADNTISATSANAGNPSASAPQVTSTNGNTPQTDCGQMVYYTSSASEILIGGESYVRVRIANDGLSDINNWTSTITFPNNWDYDVLYTPHIPNLDHTGSIYYERSDQIGVWHLLSNFNTILEERIPESDLGLPVGIDITKIRLDMGTLTGDGSWNYNTFNDDWSASFRMYGTNFGLTNGSTLDFCSTTSGVVNTINCSSTDCDATIIIAGQPIIEGGKEILDMTGNVVNTFSPGDQYKVSLHFASDPLNNTDIIGGVLVDLLPPGMTYVPGSWAYEWDSDNIQNQNPVVQTGYNVSGQQWIRFVYDASLGNGFTIVPDGTWEGFGIEFTVQIGPGVAQGLYENHYYYTSTGSDHGCSGTEYSGGSTYLGGYAFDDNYCFDSEEVEIIWAPGSAGLDSYKEGKGTLNAGYNKYPNYGTTVPGGINDYSIVLTNPNSTPINNITIIDIFPYIGDTEILNTAAPRFSEWQPNLLEPITAPAGTTLYYTTATNPCRDELATASDPTPFPSGCNSANWNTTPPIDITTVTGIKLDLGTTTLNQGDTYQLDWEMRAPVDAPTGGEIAWNSFAYIADNATTGTTLLPGEPIKVGIESFPGSVPFLGDFVWRDMNGNGIQDSGEPGQDGVTVILKHDSNANGNQDGGDIEIQRTVTANGGLYLFSNFPLGDYYVEFTNLPSGYTATHTGIGSEAMDSDGLITEILTYGSTTDNRDVDLGIYLGTLPNICDFRSSIDASQGCGISLNNNGGFEDSGSLSFNTTYNGIPAVEFTGYGNDIPNWTVQSAGSGTSYIINDASNQVNNPEGTNFYVVTTEGWCVSQGINLNAGSCYELDFWVAFYNSSGTAQIAIEVSDSYTSGGLDVIHTQNLTASTNFNNMTWYNVNFSFTPTADELLNFYFTLQNVSGSLAGGIAIDNFNVSSCCEDICNGDVLNLSTTNLNGTNPLSYNWSTGHTGPSLNITPASSSSYSVTVTDADGCTASSEIDVTVNNCEICDNGLDDDGDGDTDCEDPECGFISNHDFNYNTTDWSHWYNAPLTSNFSIDNSSQLNGIYSAMVTVNGSIGQANDVQLAQTNKTIQTGRTYVLEFDAKAALNRTIDASIDLGISPWTSFFYQSVNLTTTSQSFKFSFTSENNVIGDARVIFNLGGEDGTVWLDNIKFYEACNCDSNISLSYNIGNCIDQPLADIAVMDVTVSWNNEPGYNNDILVVQVGNTRHSIDVASGYTSPQVINFNIEANGQNNDNIGAYWYNWEDCNPYSSTFNHPNPCSNDELTCDILYLCGLDKAYDGDAWDHGFIEYIQTNNGSNTLLPILTKDEAGMGTYDPANPTTFVNVNLNNYDVIIISATTEGHISSTLVDAIKNFDGGVLLSNYLLQDELGYTSGATQGTRWGNDAYVNDTQLETILTYNNNINPWGSRLTTYGDYLSSADAYLWGHNGDTSAGQNGIIYHYDDTDILPGITSHGSRVYLGYHMNGFYANDQNGGIVPSDPDGWFDPVTHLSTLGKSLFDNALLLAGANCAMEICDNGEDDDGDNLIDCEDNDCYTIENIYPGFVIDFDNNNCSWIDYYLANDFNIIDNGDGELTIAGSIINGQDADWDACTSSPCGINDGWYLILTLSDRMEWPEFQAGGGVANVNPNCSGAETGLDYWDVTGTLMGTGCNAGQTINITGPTAPYRFQIGYGGNSGDANCEFGASTWFEANDGSNPINADIYGFINESCYDPSSEVCKVIYTNRFIRYNR